MSALRCGECGLSVSSTCGGKCGDCTRAELNQRKEMTTETKPIIDLSEWEECTEEEWADIPSENSARIQIGRSIRFFCRKPKPVRTLLAKVRERLEAEGFAKVEISAVLIAVQLIEEHYNEREEDNVKKETNL